MQIPIVDYKDAHAPSKFVKSIRETGFAVLTNTFVTKELINEVYGDFAEFFANNELKQSMLFSKETQAGYFPNGYEKAKDAKVGDLKEFFHYYPNQRGQSTIGAASDRLCILLEELGMDILGWLEEAYKTEHIADDRPWGRMVENSAGTLFRVIHYPPLTGTEIEGAVRSAAHEDINFLTLLPAATQPGLQVKDRHGNWHDVGTDENSIIVNIGDMLALMTNNFYPSTTHRVVNPTKENNARYSMPLFLHPHRDTKLSPDKTALEYLNERLKELGLL